MERRLSNRGSALAGALAVIFMLLVVVLALYQFEGTARQTYLIEESSLRFREGARFALEQQAANGTLPAGLEVTASVSNVTTSDTVMMGANVAANIFDRKAGLPDLTSLETSPSHETLKLTPQTSDLALRSFGKNTYTAVLSQVPGFAAFAPVGSVNISDLQSWANPTFNDTRPSLQSYSGVPAMVAAGQDASVGNMSYGEVHVVNGTASVGAGQGVGYKSPQFPLRDYSAGLLAQILAARSTLSTNAANGDKTTSIVGTSTGIDAVMGIFFNGQGLANFLSLRNANHFTLPMIPTFSPFPPYVYQLSFNMPFQPDGGDYSAVANQQGEITQMQTEIGTAANILTYWNNTVANDTAKGTTSLYDENMLTNATTNVTALNNSLKATSDQFMGQVNAAAAQGSSSIPTCRAQDPSNSDGLTGWCYSKMLGLIPQLLGDAVKWLVDPLSFSFTDLAKLVVNDDVHLVWFGGPNRVYNFVLDDTQMVLDATVDVPRGRTLKLHSTGTVTIKGDLWLGRGSTLMVDAPTLVVTAGSGADLSSYFSPVGRIFLEEGATLICTGDLQCVGSTQYGSVVVGGVPNQIHPITAGIFAKSVTLTSGIFAGTALDDLAEALPGLGSVCDTFLRPLMSNIAPNAAKVAGPFWARKPYFAKYATTLEIVFIPVLGIPVGPFPIPIPLPYTNMLVPVERVLGYAFSTTLDLSIGENFMTHCDWWIFGEGVVPIVPQINPKTALADLAGMPAAALGALNPSNLIDSFLKSIVQTIASYVVTNVITPIIVKVATNVIPYAGLATLATDFLTNMVTDLASKEGLQTSTGSSLTSALTGDVTNSLQNVLTAVKKDINMAEQDLYLRSYNGLLIYTDGGITIGGNNASGMFVAQGDINITSGQCVGTVMSTKGNVNVASLLFFPYFNRASLYLPAAGSSDWFSHGINYSYDSAASTSQAVDIGPPAVPASVSAQGWAQ
jgi:hypothetical protein